MNRKRLKLGLVVLISLLLVSGAMAVEKSKGIAAGQKILHIGDSHTMGDYGLDLDQFLRVSGGAIVDTFASCGSVPDWWLKGNSLSGYKPKCGFREIKKGIGQLSYDKSTPYLEDLVKKDSYNTVVVSLGTNFCNDKRVKGVADLLKIIGDDKNCFWVGAPVANPFLIKLNNKQKGTNYCDIFPVKINSEIKKQLGDKCVFIDSTNFTQLSDLDTGGIHLTATGANAWAKTVGAVILGTLGITANIKLGEDNILYGPVIPGTPAKYETVKRTSIPGCSSVASCQEIDDVWKKITLTAYDLKDWANRVYDPKSGFVGYDNYYTPKKLVSAGTSKWSPINKNAYDNLIKDAAKKFKFSNSPTEGAAMIKALIAHESSFVPTKTSDTGCKGLLQVCSWDQAYINFNKKYPHLEKELGLKNDGYDPKTNIYIGAAHLKSKMGTVNCCKEGAERFKCLMAAYNAGEGLINYASKNVGTTCGSVTWSQVNAKLQDDDWVKTVKRKTTSSCKYSYGDCRLWYVTNKKGQKIPQRYSDKVTCHGDQVSRRVCKFRNLNGYVQNIVKSYEYYKKQFGG